MVNRITKVVAVLKPSGVAMSSLISEMIGLRLISYVVLRGPALPQQWRLHPHLQTHALQAPMEVSPLIILDYMIHCHAKQLSGAQEPLSNNKQHHGKNLDTGTGGLASERGH